MPQVNFYLKKPELSGQSLIYLQFQYSGRRLVYSFGQTINPDHWNEKKQRVKSNSATTTDGKFYLNDLLDKLETICLNAYNNLLKSGMPSVSDIRKQLRDHMNASGREGQPNLFALIKRFVSNDIVYQGRERKYNTVRSYGTTYNHLQEFAKRTRSTVDFDTINLDFYYQFVSYLKKRGLSANSIGKEIKNLKTFMSEAVDMGYTSNLQFKHKKFAVPREETDAVYLSWQEIMKLYKKDLSDNKRLERVKDLFIFGCCVGLRYSDFSKISPENIVEDQGELFVKIRTQKTGAMVIIPCNPIVIELFKKYGNAKNRLPAAVSNQKFNDYIKECCKLAGMEATGRLTTDPDLQLWECVSSHTARRSFATNYYLEGFPVIDLMKITGHQTEKSFLRYIKVSKLDAARRLSKHIKKNWSEKLLKVAS